MPALPTLDELSKKPQKSAKAEKVEEPKAEETQSEEPQKWYPPQTYPTDRILFWADGNTEGNPQVAFVTSVNEIGDRNITATRIQRDSQYLLPIEKAILHKDDPRLEEMPHLRRNGVWSLSPRDVLINELAKLLD